MAWGKRSGGGGGVAWLALLVSLAALFLSWKAYERTGGELGELRVSGTESGSDWGEDLDRARERLLERRGDVESEEDLEGVRRDVAEIRENLERLSEDAGSGARERWRSLDAEPRAPGEAAPAGQLPGCGDDGFRHREDEARFRGGAGPMSLSDAVSEADRAIQAASPALWDALSPLGRRLRQSANFLPQQTAEARGKAFNATIGQITDGRGKAVSLPSMAGALGMSEAERSQAFLYSPVEGLAELRRLWRARQRGDRPESLPSSLPIVTLGAAQAWALVAEMFAAEGRAVVLAEPAPPASRTSAE